MKCSKKTPNTDASIFKSEALGETVNEVHWIASVPIREANLLMT